MEHRTRYNGWSTFFEHWGLTFMALTGIVVLAAVNLLSELAKSHSIYLLVASMALQLFGAAFILYAKVPLYQSHQFFTFGLKAIPLQRKAHYRWGWRFFLSGVALCLSFLLWNRPSL